MSTRYSLADIGALALLTTVHQLRNLERSHQPPTQYLLGVLPNFAAAIAIVLVLLNIWCDQRRKADIGTVKGRFLACVGISGGGLLAWELIQKTSNRFVFDLHDIGATIVGLAAASLLFYLLTPRSSRGAE